MEWHVRPLRGDCRSVSHYDWMYSIHWSGHAATLKPHPRPHWTTPETHRWHFLCPLPSLSLKGSAFRDFLSKLGAINRGLIRKLSSENPINCKKTLYSFPSFLCLLFCAHWNKHPPAFSCLLGFPTRLREDDFSQVYFTTALTFLQKYSQCVTERWL